MIYLDGAGRASFGVYQDAVKAVSSGPGLNDGKWHHVVGTVGPLGLRLYVDGQLVASRGDATAARYYSGVWRIGGDAVPTGWPNRPTNGYFSGSVDEIAIYGNVLSPAQVASHFVAGGGVSPQPASPSDAYGAAAFALDPDVYWRLDDSAGTTAADASRALNPGVATGGVTWGAGGALYQYSGPSASFDGVDDVIVASKPVLGGPASFSAGVWFRTTTTTGGKLIGFGNSSSGLSTSYDRHIYMQNDGTLVFGTYTGVQNRVTSATAYNDGKWHHAIGTQGLNGMALYVDGVLVGTHPATKGQVYDGYWRIGGDTTWGSTSRYFRGQLDEALVFDRALSSQEVAGLHAKGVAPAANQLPVASFTAQSVGLAVEVDASASTDADGTIASYAWDFGDGSRGSGPTDTHVYPRPGTYTIVLTVTDDRGAEASEARTVTVEALPNQAPQAAFTASVSLLTVSLDGSGSSDPDGSIATYAWDFGDGTTGSGKQPADHVYATAGSYKVTLTVTDDDGATASTSKTVTVTATYASDAFGRTVASGWGTADLGGAWTTGSASLFAVSSGQGRITVAASKGPQIYLASSTATDADVRADFTVDRAATGGGTYLSLVARGATNEGYRGKGRIMPDGSVQLSVVRALAGVETTLGTASLPAGTFAAGDTLKFRMVAAGLAPTSLRLKVWKSTVTQPANWQITATDSTAGLQKAGGVGVIGFLSGTATNGPAIVGVDNVAAVLFGTAD
jgi:PKD repeat protein